MTTLILFRANEFIYKFYYTRDIFPVCPPVPFYYNKFDMLVIFKYPYILSKGTQLYLFEVSQTTTCTFNRTTSMCICMHVCACVLVCVCGYTVLYLDANLNLNPVKRD